MVHKNCPKLPFPHIYTSCQLSMEGHWSRIEIFHINFAVWSNGCAWKSVLMITSPLEGVTSPLEGVARYCFHPVCLCVCVSVCPANILLFYFSATRRDIDLKLIQDTYRVVLVSLKKLTFIGQRSRSQGRYIAFWRYSHITKTEP